MELPRKKTLRRLALIEIQNGVCALQASGRCLLPGVPMTVERGDRRGAPPDSFASLSVGGPLGELVSHYKCVHEQGRGPRPVMTIALARPRAVKLSPEARRREGGIRIDRWNQQNGRCPWCGEALALEAATMEHIIPESHGGTRAFANMAVSHDLCNRKRSSNIWQDPVPGPAFDFIRERLARVRQADSAGEHLLIVDGKALLRPLRVRVERLETDRNDEPPIIRWS